MRPFLIASLAVIASGSVAAAQAGHGAHPAPAGAKRLTAPAGRVVTVTARDYAFDAPDTVAAGLTTMRLVNRGPELHHVQLLRLDDGKTMRDLFAAMQAGGPPPAWVHDVGGPNTPVPGGESQTAVELVPGRYVLACFIPSPDQKPHVAKGMAREMIVTTGGAAGAARASSAGAARGAAPVTLTLSDYKFALSRPLTAGRQTVRVRNAAAQSHEVLFVKLAPGKTARDVAAWSEKQEGPPPGQPMGGTTGIATDGWNDVSLDLEPGEYALLCFLPDAKDGKPHVAHGMVHQLRVEGTRRTASTAGTR
jgi:hypothetical protein